MFGGSLSLNTVIILIVTVSMLLDILHSKLKKDEYFIVLLGFAVYSLVTLPISATGDLGAQLGNLIQFIITDILPVVMLIYGIKKEKDLRAIIKTYVVVSFVCCLYGVVTFALGKNPYIEILADVYQIKRFCFLDAIYEKHE